MGSVLAKYTSLSGQARASTSPAAGTVETELKLSDRHFCWNDKIRSACTSVRRRAQLLSRVASTPGRNKLCGGKPLRLGLIYSCRITWPVLTGLFSTWREFPLTEAQQSGFCGLLPFRIILADKKKLKPSGSSLVWGTLDVPCMQRELKLGTYLQNWAGASALKEQQPSQPLPEAAVTLPAPHSPSDPEPPTRRSTSFCIFNSSRSHSNYIQRYRDV